MLPLRFFDGPVTSASKSKNWSCAVLPISWAAAAASWTPASSITIWFEPCLRISGSETPSLSMRLRMIETERSRSAAVSVWPFGGTAFRTTSRPPWRSRPSVGFLCAGEPEIASRSAPTRAARIRPISVRCWRRLLTGALQSSFPPVRSGLLLGLLVRPLRREDARDRAPGDPDLDLGGDPDEDVVVPDIGDLAVEPAGGDDLVAGGDAPQHRFLGKAAPLLRAQDREPHEEEGDRDQNESGWVHVASMTPRAARPSRASASALKSASCPRSIAARAPAVRSSRKRRLCRLSSRNPSSSSWLTRWRM